MAHPNTISNFGAEQGQVLICPGHLRFGGNIGDIPNYAVQLVRPSVAPNVDSYHFPGYYDVVTNGQNPCNYVRTCHPHLNHEVCPMMPSNFSTFGASASSSSRPVPVSRSFSMGNALLLSANHQASAASNSENERHDHLSDNTRSLSKRKNFEVAGGTSGLVDVSSSSGSTSYISRISGMQQWDPSFGHASAPNLRAYNSWLPSEGSSTTAVNSSTFRPEFAHPNTFPWSVSYVGQCFETPNNMWSAPDYNSVADVPPPWAVNPMSSPQGALSISSTVDITSGGPREFQNNVNQGFVPYFHQRPFHMLPVPSRIDHSQVHEPYLQPLCANSSTSSLCLQPRYVPLVQNVDSSVRLARGPMQANLGIGHGSVRILPPEHAPLMDVSRFYEDFNVIDEHRDLRLDIDGMTYEELLALEDQIGDVSTGLSEEFILRNLKISLYLRGLQTPSCNLSVLSMEDEACIICQVDYDEGEHVGTLECGHRYHADCIKQWLKLKNLCPICKTSALTSKKKDG